MVPIATTDERLAWKAQIKEWSKQNPTHVWSPWFSQTLGNRLSVWSNSQAARPSKHKTIFVDCVLTDTTHSHRESKACIANLGKIPKMPNPHIPNDPPTSHGSLGLWTQAQGASKIISRNGMVARMPTSWSTMDQKWGKSVAMARTSPNAIQSVLCRYVRYQKYSKLKKKMRCTSLHQLHCQPCEMSSNAHWHAVHCEFSTSSNTRFWDSGRCTAKVEPLCNAASSRSNASSEAQAKRKASIAQTC